jgi:superfamily II DNA or RNA helicase
MRITGTTGANKNYAEFLRSKAATVESVGFKVEPSGINPMLSGRFEFQRDIVRVACQKGRYAVFAECGLGKTYMETEYARLVNQYTGGKTLMVAPLAVTKQTIRMAARLDVTVQYCRSQAEADASDCRVIITNYEMIEAFDFDRFAAVVLDESGILKNFTGKTKQKLIAKTAKVRFRLAASATPAPNDHLELGNQAEWLGVMPSNLMIARWFLNDTMHAGHYRLKRHAETDFWDWVTSWSVCISKPSDLGYSDEGFELPPLNWRQHLIDVDHTAAWDRQIAEQQKQNQQNLGKTNFGQIEMFARGVSSATSVWKDRSTSLEARCQKVLEIVGAADPSDPWIIWTDLNSEADYLRKQLPQAVEVRGSDTLREKERKLDAFSTGEARVIITKADIAGFGLNWQHCSQMVSAGANFSYDQLHQKVRRCYRFGQTRPVDVHLVVAETDHNLLSAIQRKQTAFEEMQAKMNQAMRRNGLYGQHAKGAALSDYNPTVPMAYPAWLQPHEERIA